jgi:hypothetical protein
MPLSLGSKLSSCQTKWCGDRAGRSGSRRPICQRETRMSFASLFDVRTSSYTTGTLRNASAGEKRKPIPKNSAASSSRPPNSNATHHSSGTAHAQSSSRPQAQATVTTSSTAPAVAVNSGATTSSTNPHAMIKHAGRWTRFWLFICCASPEYTDGHH